MLLAFLGYEPESNNKIQSSFISTYKMLESVRKNEFPTNGISIDVIIVMFTSTTSLYSCYENQNLKFKNVNIMMNVQHAYIVLFIRNFMFVWLLIKRKGNTNAL